MVNGIPSGAIAPVSLWPARGARRGWALPAVTSLVVHGLAAAWLLAPAGAPPASPGLEVRIVDRRPGSGGAPRPAVSDNAPRPRARPRRLELAPAPRPITPPALPSEAVALASRPADSAVDENDPDARPGGTGGVGVGNGDGAGGGGSGTGGAVAEPVPARPRDLDAVSERLRRYLVYPPRARRAHWEGRVILAFILRSDGSVCGLRVAASSGSVVLDDAAVEAIVRAAPFAPPGIDVRVEIPVTFRLT